MAVNFFVDEAKVLKETPLVISKHHLSNKGKVDQAMEFSFSVTKGKTTSFSETVGFKFGAI